jgi:histidinol-phosphatase (PHP family)
VRLPDYHTHTALCGHASGRPTDYVQSAKARGLLGIGIADHLPLLPEADPELTMSAGELAAYVAEVQALKAEFPGYVLLGVEADYRPHTVFGVRALLEAHPFDYTIGSVHFLEDWGFDDPRHIGGYADRDIDEIWIDYLQLVGDAAESGLFTILGHLDLVKKFGYRPTKTLEAELARLVDRIAQAGALVEINTAGLHKPAGEAYPTLDILRRLCEAGVAITFGSDAHRPDDVGRDFEHAAKLARAAGFTSFASLKEDPSGGRARAQKDPLPSSPPSEEPGPGEPTAPPRR